MIELPENLKDKFNEIFKSKEKSFDKCELCGETVNISKNETGYVCHECPARGGEL